MAHSDNGILLSNRKDSSINIANSEDVFQTYGPLAVTTGQWQ